MDDFIEDCRKRIDNLESQNRLFDDGTLAAHEQRLLADGTAPWADITQVVFERNRMWIAELQRVLANNGGRLGL